MKTVDPGQILICHQKSTSTVLHGHVNPFARNLHLQCRSNLARDSHRSTFVRFSWPGLVSTLPLWGGLKSTRGEISTRVKRNASCKRAIHFVHMAGWNLTRVELNPGWNASCKHSLTRSQGGADRGGILRYYSIHTSCTHTLYTLSLTVSRLHCNWYTFRSNVRARPTLRNFELLSGRAWIATHKYVLVTQIWSGSGSRNDIALVTWKDEVTWKGVSPENLIWDK